MREAQITRQVLESRWTARLMLALDGRGDTTFTWLMNEVAGISDRVLSERLRALVLLGLVYRRTVASRPVTVHYRLSSAGDYLVLPLRAMRAAIQEVSAP